MHKIYNMSSIMGMVQTEDDKFQNCSIVMQDIQLKANLI